MILRGSCEVLLPDSKRHGEFEEKQTEVSVLHDIQKDLLNEYTKRKGIIMKLNLKKAM
jgi:hypothetical protein